MPNDPQDSGSAPGTSDQEPQDATLENVPLDQLTDDQLAAIIDAQASQGMGDSDEAPFQDSADDQDPLISIPGDPGDGDSIAAQQSGDLTSLQEEIAGLRKRLEDRETTIGRQGAELGELRASVKVFEKSLTPKEPSIVDSDESMEEILQDKAKFIGLVKESTKDVVRKTIEETGLGTQVEQTVGLVDFISKNPKDWSEKISAINELSKSDPLVGRLYSVDPEAALSYAMAKIGTPEASPPSKKPAGNKRAAGAIGGKTGTGAPPKAKPISAMSIEELEKALPKSKDDPPLGKLFGDI